MWELFFLGGGRSLDPNKTISKSACASYSLFLRRCEASSMSYTLNNEFCYHALSYHKNFLSHSISCLTWQVSKKEMAEGEINGDVVIKKLWIVKGRKKLPLPTPSVIWAQKVKILRAHPRGLQKDVVYLGGPIAPTYMSPNAGGGGKLQGLSQWVQLYAGAQINFEDLTPFLTYGPPLPMPSSLPHRGDVNLLRSDGRGRRNQHRWVKLIR